MNFICTNILYGNQAQLVAQPAPQTHNVKADQLHWKAPEISFLSFFLPSFQTDIIKLDEKETTELAKRLTTMMNEPITTYSVPSDPTFVWRGTEGFSRDSIRDRLPV